MRQGPFDTNETFTPYQYVTGYNNFYEFGTDKSDPAKYAGRLRARPWTITAEVKRPAVYVLEDFIRPYALGERIYRLRCVEGWSMVIA